MNSLIKRILEWKEVTLDALAQILYRQSRSTYNEIIRGRYGLGNYIISEDYAFLYDLKRDEPKMLEVIESPEEIVNKVLSGETLCAEVVFEFLL